MGDPLIPTSTPPGWYPDPWRHAWWRWWDGAGWTGYTEQPIAAVGSSPPEAGIRAGGIAILGFLVGLGLSTVMVIFLSLAGYEISDPAMLLGSTLGLWIGLGGSCVVAVRRKGTGSLRDLGLVPPRWVDAALGAGFAVAGFIAVVIAAAVLHAINSNLLPSDRTDLTDPIQRGSALGIVVVYLIACVGAPFFEELYFRGLVQSTFSVRWGLTAGIILQAPLFALVHLTPDNGWGNVGTFVIILIVGLGLGMIRRFTGRLPPGMFTHAGYNAIIVTIALITTK